MSSTSPESGGSSETAVSNEDPAHAQSKGGKVACRVPGCTERPQTGFLMRCRCCELHSRQVSLDLNGCQQRFCQQCGFFHPLEEFDELRRSCRRSLERHRVCRRMRRERAAGKQAAAAALQPGQDALPSAATLAQQAASEDGPLPTPQLNSESLPASANAGKGRSQRAKRAAPADAAEQPSATSRKRVRAKPLKAAGPKLEALDTEAGTGNSGSTAERGQPQQQPQRQVPSQPQPSSRSRLLSSAAHVAVRLSPAPLDAQGSFVRGATPPAQLPAPLIAPSLRHAGTLESPSQASMAGSLRPWQPGSASAVVAAAQRLTAAPPPAAAQALVAPPLEWHWTCGLEAMQPFVQQQLAAPPPSVLVEEALRILRAPTPSFVDMPSMQEMLDITADLGVMEGLLQQRSGPRQETVLSPLALPDLRHPQLNGHSLATRTH